MIRSTRYRYVRVFVLVFELSSKLIVLCRSLCFPPPADYTRIADQNVTSTASTQHSAQHRATINSSAQAALGI